jgi:hypothetical protein
MVSHSLIDAILISGIMFFMLGMVYTFASVFGKMAGGITPRLLGGSMGVIYGILLAINFNRGAGGTPLVAYGLGGFVLGALLLGQPQRISSPPLLEYFRSRFVQFRIVFSFAVLLPVLSLYLHVSFIPSLFFVVLSSFGETLVEYLYASAYQVETRVSSRQLGNIGFLLTLLAFFTQFVPPVLDLLGIKIVS